jgi:capsular exopolysaccharide synthesis family protein
LSLPTRQLQIVSRVGAESISDLLNNSISIPSGPNSGRPAEKPPEPAIISMLWRRRNIIGWFTLGAFVLGFIYILFARNYYKSTAEIYIVQGESRVIGQSSSADSSRSDDYLNTQCELMTSTPVLALALAQDGIKDLETIRDESDPIAYLQQNIDAEVGKHNDLIYVSLEAHEKYDAAKLVNAVVGAYVTYQTRIQHSNSAEVLDLLQKEKTRDQDAIAAKNKELADLRSNYGETAYDTSANNPIIQQETALSNALTAARLDAVNAKSAYDRAMVMVNGDADMLKQIEAPDSPADMVAASPDQLQLIQTQIIQYEQAIQDMERTYLPDHPRVVLAKSRLNQLTVIYVRAERQRYLSAQAQEKALEKSFEQQHQLVLQQATRSADFDRVRSELASIQKALDVVESRTNEVIANQDAGSLNIEITQPALPAARASRPAKTHVLAAWLLVGFLLGCVAAVGLEKFPMGARPMSQLSAELGAPVIGVLPAMPGITSFTERALQGHYDPAGPVAESARSISRLIADSGLDDVGGRTLLIASMNPLEGRTTLATNLAVAMAQSGMRVLLIDANIRAPRLHHIFKLDNSIGLFDILHGGPVEKKVTQSTTVENVEVLTAGNLTGNAVELLNSELLIDLLGEYSDQYDRVIVDSPALGRGVEARILAANCAAAILVTAARPTARRQVGFGLKLLRSVGANVLGLVINEPATAEPRKPIRPRPNALRDPLFTDPARSFRSTLATGTED